jgi:hypothetical protein
MLYRIGTAPSSSPPKYPASPAPIRATGRNLKRLLHGKPPRVRAKAGAKLVNGEFAFTAPTVPQAARLVGCPAQLIHAELGHRPKPPSDVQIDRLVAKLGADRVMASLDRLTKPSLLAAE